MLGNQPVIKILKRPPNLVSTEQVNGINNCNVKPQPVVKSLQQREMEYAEARLRIFGTSENDEKLRNNDKNQFIKTVKEWGTNEIRPHLSCLAMAKPTLSMQLNEVPKRIIKPARKDNVIRYPRGPDGTKGFHTRHRENVADINCEEGESDQFNLISNGLLDASG